MWNAFKQAVSNQLEPAFIWTVCLVIFSSCGEEKIDKSTKVEKNANGSVDSIITEGNKTTIFSNDIDRLGKVLNFGEFKPHEVKFKYVFHDNSGNEKRVSVPGPSDYSLEAYIKFSRVTLSEIRTVIVPPGSDTATFSKEAFIFDWLDKGIQKMVKESNRGGIKDKLYNSNNGSCFPLKNAILLKASSN